MKAKKTFKLEQVASGPVRESEPALYIYRFFYIDSMRRKEVISNLHGTVLNKTGR